MNISGGMTFGQRLRRERQTRGWTQEELAAEIDTTKLSIIRWENGQREPQPLMRRKLYAVFGKTSETFGALTIWNVPFERNPYFRGRDDILANLYKELTSKTGAASARYALCGFGGIGKTQTAVEYAYRYAEEYNAILWVQSASPKLLASNFASLVAQPLNLPEKVEMDQRQAIMAVKYWLQTHSSWLLIFDNVEEIGMIADFLPTWRQGSVLLTTRQQAWGKHFNKIDIEKLNPEESILLLLLRARRIEHEHHLGGIAPGERQAAECLCELLDGLPLAIEQAAAYIEEHQCSVADYLKLYQAYPNVLLEHTSTLEEQDYPHSLAKTWNLSFQKIEQTSLAAADLLYLCAFLHPDAIPEEIITQGAARSGSYLQSIATEPSAFNTAIKPLLSHSFIRRNDQTGMLTIHRLVQTVIKGRMSRENYRQWAERTVQAVEVVFPDGQFTTWSDCELYLPHAQICTGLIEQENMSMPEAAYLLNRVGYYLTNRARYTEAEPLLLRSLAISEQLWGAEHLDTATTLNNLATVYRELCKNEEAELLYLRALTIREQQLGLQHLDTARTLRDLALLYEQQYRYAEAEALAQRALIIREQLLGSQHPDTAQSLDDLGMFYYTSGKYQEAEPLVQRALAIRERVLGEYHPDTAESLNDLALLYFKQKRYDDAIALYTRALAIFEQELGPRHRYTATVMNNLAQVYKEQGCYAEAEILWQQVRAIREQVLGPRHPDMSNVLLYLAMIYNLQGRYTEAEPLLQEALVIREGQPGVTHPDVAPILFNLAILYSGQQRYLEAEHALRRTLTIRQRQLGVEHPDTLHCLHSLALLYAFQGQYDLAESLYSRS